MSTSPFLGGPLRLLVTVALEAKQQKKVHEPRDDNPNINLLLEVFDETSDNPDSSFGGRDVHATAGAAASAVTGILAQAVTSQPQVPWNEIWVEEVRWFFYNSDVLDSDMDEAPAGTASALDAQTDTDSGTEVDSMDGDPSFIVSDVHRKFRDRGQPLENERRGRHRHRDHLPEIINGVTQTGLPAAHTPPPSDLPSDEQVALNSVSAVLVGSPSQIGGSDTLPRVLSRISSSDGIDVTQTGLPAAHTPPPSDLLSDEQVVLNPVPPPLMVPLPPIGNSDTLPRVLPRISSSDGIDPATLSSTPQTAARDPASTAVVVSSPIGGDAVSTLQTILTGAIPQPLSAWEKNYERIYDLSKGWEGGYAIVKVLAWMVTVGLIFIPIALVYLGSKVYDCFYDRNVEIVQLT